MSHRRTLVLGITAGALLLGAAVVLAATSSASATPGSFKGDRMEVQKYMELYATIHLTPAQERVRQAALADLPAPCCSNYSAATCCCECNLARSAWGVAKDQIVHHGADAATVRAAVTAWFAAINPSGFSGDSCFTGRCNLPHRANGCGGMQAGKLID